MAEPPATQPAAVTEPPEETEPQSNTQHRVSAVRAPQAAHVKDLQARFGGQATAPPPWRRRPAAAQVDADAEVEAESALPAAQLLPPVAASCATSRKGSVMLAPSADAKIPIQLSMRVRRTFDLDNVKQMFGCNLHLIMAWPSDEEVPQEMLTPASAGYEWQPKWKPRFIVKNVMELINVTSMYTIKPNPDAGVLGEKPSIVTSEMRMLIRIFYDMDLHMFPFDVQRFSIVVRGGEKAAEPKAKQPANSPGAQAAPTRARSGRGHAVERFAKTRADTHVDAWFAPSRPNRHPPTAPDTRSLSD